MLDQYISECMVSIININKSIKEPFRGYQICNTNQILIFGGYVKARESLHIRVIIWVNTILNCTNTSTILLMYESICVMERWTRKEKKRKEKVLAILNGDVD